MSMLCVGVNSPSSLCVRVRVAAFRIRSVRSKPVIGDADPIRTCARYAPDTQRIRRLIHEMIRRLVPVRAVKTERQFGFETASFHVSVLCLFIEYFGIIHELLLTYSNRRYFMFK